jgi:hypothetical protein
MHISFSCMFISILFKFWTAMCPSSGELIVSVWHLVYVTLCTWLSAMQVWMELYPNLHTRRSSTQSYIPRPCTRFQTPFHKTSTCSNMQSHQRISPTFPLSWPETQRYPYTTNSLSISYWSVPYSPMQPPSGATHHRPIIDISKYYNPNVLELSVTTLDIFLSHTFIPPSHSNPFTSLFIA